MADETRSSTGYYFTVTPLQYDGNDFVELQISHAMNILGQSGMPDASTLPTADDAVRLCRKQLLSIRHAEGQLAKAAAFRVRVRDAATHVEVDTTTIYRGELFCPSCGSKDLVPTFWSESDFIVDKGFEFDRRNCGVLYAARYQVTDVICQECSCDGPVNAFVVGIDMTAAKLGIRYVSVREDFVIDS